MAHLTDDKAALELGFELDATYRDGYWNDTHTIINAFFANGRALVVSKWSDGHETTHCTWLGKRDKKVSL